MANLFTLLFGIGDYNFFDFSQDLRTKGYHGQDKLSAKCFIVMGILFLLIVIISILLRKVKKEKVFTVYKVLSIFMPINEIGKMIFSTVGDLTHGETFNWGGILPFYTCSMILYFLPFVAWGKGGKMQKWSMAYFTTIGLVAGLSNFIYLSTASFYPIFSYGGLYSVIFHAVIVFIGMSLMITGIYVPRDYKTINRAMIPVLMFGAIVLPLNFIIIHATGQGYTDYMLLVNANGFSPFGEWSDWLKQYNLRFLFSFFMLLVMYPLATAAITYVDIGVVKLVELIRNKTAKNTAKPA